MIYLYLYLFISLSTVSSDNIDTKFPITFTYEKSNSNSKSSKESYESYFGYSLSVNQEDDENYVMIGAPRFNSQLYGNVEKPGAVFHCQWKESDSVKPVICNQIDAKQAKYLYKNQNDTVTNKMLLGSSLTSNNSNFVVCAHAWAAEEHVNDTLTPVGKCYTFNNTGIALNSFEVIVFSRGNLQRTSKVPKKHKITSHSHMMSGFSSAFINSGKRLVLGSPGYLYFTGTIIRESQDSKEFNDFIEWKNYNNKFPTVNGYFGYSVTTGFLDGKQEYTIIGAPRNEKFNGKVYYLPSNIPYDDRTIRNYSRVIEGDHDPEEEAEGEYFGASLLALDINNDKFDDLIIGAPFYSNQKYREMGRIYVLINNKNFGFEKKHIYNYKTTSRFGTALSSIDINLDGYKDAIIGAPYELNSDKSLGAIYIYFGSSQGLNDKYYKRIAAENLQIGAPRGFGISIVSNTDFDKNGYSDMLVGSYMSEHTVLIRTKPIATLDITSITFEPSKIELHKTKCNNNQNLCFDIKYCIRYSGKHIRHKQMAVITLKITDSKLKVKENRAKISNSDTKTIELEANKETCSPNQNSFKLMVNTRENLIDILTPIQVNFSVALTNQSSDVFCKDCAYSQSYSSIADIEFSHGCINKICLSDLNLTVVSKYNGETIQNHLIEGINDNLDVDINVKNSGEASIDTILIVKMKPLLNLTKTAEAERCKAHANMSSYFCDVNKILQKGESEKLNLHFIVSGILTNNIDIDFEIISSSNIKDGSMRNHSVKFNVIRRATLEIFGESVNNLTYSDSTPKLPFSVSYNLYKSGPSTISNSSLEFSIPAGVIELENNFEQICKTETKGKERNSFQITNGTIHLVCDKESEFCTKYSCELLKFDSVARSQSVTISAALIPSKIKIKDYDGIDLTIYSELIVKDKVEFENKITSSETVLIRFNREAPIANERIDPTILFFSAGLGIFILIITVIILIRYGFFRRKKREQLQKIKQRMSMKPDSFDVTDLDLDSHYSNDASNDQNKQAN